MGDYSRKQWIILIVFCVAQFFNAVCVSLQAPFYPHEAELKGATATEYSFVFSVFELTVFIVSPIYGTYLDKIGVNFLNNAGLFTVSVSCILFGFLNKMPTTALFLTFSFLIRIIEAMGNAAFITTAFSIVAQEFPNNVASAFATLETFFGFGLIAGPTVGGALYELGGFTLPFVVLGSVLSVATVTVWFFLPAELGGTRPAAKHSVFDILKQPRILLAACTTAAGSISISFLQATLEPHIRSLNLTPIQIGLMFVLNGLSYAVSTPVWGRLCDKCCPERVVSGVGAVIVAISFILIGPCPLLPVENSLAICITALIIHGVGFGAELVSTFSGTRRDAIRAGLPDDITTYGLVSGLWASAFALGAFIGPSIAGVLFDTVGFGWGTSLVALIHIIVAIITLFCCCFTKSNPNAVDERSSLLNTSIEAVEDADSTYGSAENSTENIARGIA